MNVYDSRPWVLSACHTRRANVAPQYPTILGAFQAAVTRSPEHPIVYYFDDAVSMGELDDLSDAFAVGLLEGGFVRGDRLATVMQNIPQALVAALGTWKAGGILVALNPMSTVRDIENLLADSGAVALVAETSLIADAARAAADRDVRIIWAADPHQHHSDDDASPIPANPVGPQSTLIEELAAVLARHVNHRPPRPDVAGSDIACLAYTSGTTGPAKGAMISHANLACSAQTYRDWVGLSEADVILATAPLFHVTGIVGHLGLALLLGAPLVLTYRFEPTVVAEACRRHRPTFTVGSITAFIALMNVDTIDAKDLSSLRRIYCGGAPIPQARSDEFFDRFGVRLHNIYGMTETTSPSHAVPFGAIAPIDPASGAMSVGIPVFDTVARVRGEDGADVGIGELGEISVSGPQVVSGYWNKPAETADGFTDGYVHTGDIGYVDHQGWFYVIDRIKDQINTAGYKVWPREVEDVLNEHPDVYEAAVVGVPDSYRGETVKAFVSPRAGAELDPEELIAFTKARLAAYKYPRHIEVRDSLPRTASGKILRRELRALPSP